MSDVKLLLDIRNSGHRGTHRTHKTLMFDIATPPVSQHAHNTMGLSPNTGYTRMASTIQTADEDRQNIARSKGARCLSVAETRGEPDLFSGKAASDHLPVLAS